MSMKVTLNLDAENDSDLEDKVFEYLKKKREKKLAQKVKKQNEVIDLTKPSSITQTLENAKEMRKQRDIEKSIFRSVEAKRVKALPPVPDFIRNDKPIFWEETYNDKVQVILVHGWYRKQIGNAPKSFDLLQKIVVDNIRSKNGSSVTINDFKMHYYDFNSEKTEIEDQYDL